MNELDDLKYKLARLQMAHKDLDDQLRALMQGPSPNIMHVQRMKKEKLSLKEQIDKIENDLIPDIIA